MSELQRTVLGPKSNRINIHDAQNRVDGIPIELWRGGIAILWRPPSHRRLGRQAGLHEYIMLYMTLVEELVVIVSWNSEHTNDPIHGP